ncbi:hypothetical protein HED49_20000 [Ochrobactrum daejeonense]|nr:hypothetical protein [Brucella daejeonensis]
MLIVGYNGAGTLDIRDGATVTGGGVILGYSNGIQPASITVDGNGSALCSLIIWTLGDAGDDATLTVSNGGYVDVASGSGNDVIVGGGTGSTGHVIVTGEGSAFNVHDNVLILGFGGDGDLTIADGGQVTGYQLYLGNWQGVETPRYRVRTLPGMVSMAFGLDSSRAVSWIF